MIGGEENELNEPSLPSHQDAFAVASPSSSFPPSSSENDTETRNEKNQSNENTSRELIPYDPSANGGSGTELVSEPAECQNPSFIGRFASNSSPRLLPSVGTFTVQCANCFKWRLIPTKEKYEEIREHLLEQPFYCETAREWRPDISCDDPADITQDGSRLWAIDKPNIAQPPPGWQRQLRIRGEGGTRFADVYYVAPSGKTLRSTVDIQKYLVAHPEYATDDVSMERFSFQIPKPLQENYVKKRRAPVNASSDGTRLLGPSEASPISWACPDDSPAFSVGRPGFHSPLGARVSDSATRSAKKKAKRGPAKEMHPSTPPVFDEAPSPSPPPPRFDERPPLWLERGGGYEK